MFAPRFTLRTGLIALTAGAFVAIVLREATFGKSWAIGIMAALGFVVLSLLMQAIAFTLALLLSRDRQKGDRS